MNPSIVLAAQAGDAAVRPPNGHGENATTMHESAMASLTCSAHIRLQANVVQQADSMLPETPASPPNPSPARGRGGRSEPLSDSNFKKSRSPTARAWLFLLPAMLFLFVLVVASLLVLRMSVGVKGEEWTAFSLASYGRLLEPYYMKSLLLTMRLALVSSVIAVALAIPVGLAMARLKSPLMRQLFLAAVLLPLLVNLLLQSYGWLVILGPAGLLNKLLLSLGVIERPLMLLYNQTGVLLGLVQTAFPLAVLPIASAVRGVSRSYEEAAAMLGASRLQVLRQVVLPMSMPGIMTGATLVFAYNASSFVVPMLLGGRRVPMLAVVVHDQIAPLLDWPSASAGGVILILSTLAVMGLSEYFTGRSRRALEVS